MAATQRYRAQHAELVALTNQITALWNDGNFGSSATEVRNLVSDLAGKLSIHLAMEDKRLYPILMAHADPDVRALAGRYSDEMGTLADDFAQFNRRWLTAGLIEKAPKEFIADAKRVLAALAMRIEKENGELFKLLDGLEG